MSILVAAIGNTYTTIGLIERASGDVAHLESPNEESTPSLAAHWRVGTDVHRTPDEWGVLVTSLLDSAGGIDAVDGVSICATVPAVGRTWRTMLAARLPDCDPVVIEPGVRTGIGIRTDNPREVGADRIMNAVAAVARYGYPAVVVDFSTATTVDVIDDSGRYIGGAIAPGLEMSVEALGSRAAQLRQVELTAPRRVIGRNTVEAMQSGMVFGFAGLVDGMVERVVAELGIDREQVTVIATGHSADVVASQCASFDEFDPWLVLFGLELAFRRNQRR